MSNFIRVGLAAYGMSGKVFHAPLITSHPKLKLVKVLERTKSLSKLDFPEIEITRNFKSLAVDQEIDLIVVNTPDHLHFQMAKEALENGKHVVVEKPFTVTTQEAEELIALAKEKQKVLSVFQNRRWDGDFLTVKKVLEGKLLGRLVEFESHFDRYRNFIKGDSWKEDDDTGTGSHFNLGSHLIDQALVLFGKPLAITADLRMTRTGSEVVDYFDIRFDYEELRVTLKSGYLVREARPRFALHSTLGSFVKYGLDPQEEDLKEGFLPIEKDWGTEPKEEWGMLNADIAGVHVEGDVETVPGDYLAYYQNIYEAIQEGKALLVKPEESLEGIKLLELAIKSSEEKRTIYLNDL